MSAKSAKDVLVGWIEILTAGADWTKSPSPAYIANLIIRDISAVEGVITSDDMWVDALKPPQQIKADPVNRQATMVDKKCKCCKKAMQVRQADVNRGWGLYCSKSCKAKVQEKKNGQHAAYLHGRGVSNLHPERLSDYNDCALPFDPHEPFDDYVIDNDDHPHSPDGHGQWND